MHTFAKVRLSLFSFLGNGNLRSANTFFSNNSYQFLENSFVFLPAIFLDALLIDNNFLSYKIVVSRKL